MKTIESTIVLETNDTTKELVFHALYQVQEHFTFSTRVKSCGFAGESSFCLSKSDIATFVSQLDELYKCLNGSVRINDYDSDANIAFSANLNGQIVVSGQLGGSQQEQFLKFSFDTDQTSLPRFIQSFAHLNSKSE